MGITSLVVCGLTTAVCVGLTARQTADRGFRVVMVSDACTELSQEMHDAALLSFSHLFWSGPFHAGTNRFSYFCEFKDGCG